MAGTRKSSKTSIESTVEDQLNELKDLLSRNQPESYKSWNTDFKQHSELLGRIDAADKNAKEALQLVKNNEAMIDELIRQENQALKEKIKVDIIEGAQTSQFGRTGYHEILIIIAFKIPSF